MTENEALKIAIHCLGVQAEQEVCEECPVYRESGIVCKEIARTAISALKEIQQYREIGTVEECRGVVERKKAKPCEFYGDREDGKLLCPNCGEDLWDLKECGFNNCPYCGQAIQWGENLKGMEDE